jgi:hypothetical protein
MLFQIGNVENLLYTYFFREYFIHIHIGILLLMHKLALPFMILVWYFWLAFGMLSTLTWL